MSEIDKSKVQFAFAGLAELFDKKMPITTQRLYLMALEDLGTERIVQACRIAMSACKFFPKPAELRELVRLPEDDIEHRAQLAWQAVKENAIGRIVHTGKPLDFQDPITNAAVREVGGLNYLALQGTDTEHEKYTRPRFLEAYKRLASCSLLPPSKTEPLKSRVTKQKEPILIPCPYRVEPRIKHVTAGIAKGLAEKISIREPKDE